MDKKPLIAGEKLEAGDMVYTTGENEVFRWTAGPFPRKWLEDIQKPLFINENIGPEYLEFRRSSLGIDLGADLVAPAYGPLPEYIVIDEKPGVGTLLTDRVTRHLMWPGQFPRSELRNTIKPPPESVREWDYSRLISLAHDLAVERLRINKPRIRRIESKGVPVYQCSGRCYGLAWECQGYGDTMESAYKRWKEQALAQKSVADGMAPVLSVRPDRVWYDHG